MNFRLTKKKGWFSLVVCVLWYVFLLYSFLAFERNALIVCSGQVCKDPGFELIPFGVRCGACPDTLDLLGRNVVMFWVILLPGILVYLIWSLLEKKV